MVRGNLPLGCSGLLRVAGLPIRYWLLGANPALFRKIERLERLERQHRAHAIQLAERIGRELVPDPALSREDRAFFLALRRALHRGDLPAKVTHEQLRTMSEQYDNCAELLHAIAATIDRDQQIAQLAAEVTVACVCEEERLWGLPEQIYADSPVAKALFTFGTVEFKRHAHQSQKQRRHRFEKEWHTVTRATTASTPRGWLSHVALLPIEATHASIPQLSEHYSAQWTENVRLRRAALATPPDDWPYADSRFAMNPLHWDADGQFVTVVLGRGDEQTRVAVRHTPLLDEIRQALPGATHTFGELATALGCEQPDEWNLLRPFVRHLMVLGILQPSAAPTLQLEPKATPGRTFAHLTDDSPNPGGWIDVYRSAERGISERIALDVQRGVSQALRILGLMRDANLDVGQRLIRSSKQSWRFSEILEAELNVNSSPIPSPRGGELSDDQSYQSSSNTGYSRLINGVIEAADSGSEFTIDARMLDEYGAQDVGFIWPVDCLVRLPAPSAGFSAVLDQIWPPGTLDARFADTLVDLSGRVPHVEVYRAFLQRLEQLTGVLFVELLAPPLTDDAANAVRRPTYTRAWTGDPDRAMYLRHGDVQGRYIPLDAIRIRRIDGRLRADFDGQPLWPVHHATRSFSSPWDRIARVLLAAAPFELPWDYSQMIQSLTRRPEYRRVPRISVSGGLVLSPAQWRLSPDQLWERSAPLLTKLRALIRLRNRYAWPRWVYLQPADDKTSVPCDLESILAIRAIERCASNSTSLLLVEMLPTPDQLLVVDRAHHVEDHVASQLQLRFPHDETALSMATRIAPSVCAAFGLPVRIQDGITVPTKSRDPPEIYGSFA